MSDFLGTYAIYIFLNHIPLSLLKLKGMTQVVVVPRIYKTWCNRFLALYNGTYSRHSAVTPTPSVSKQRCES